MIKWLEKMIWRKPLPAENGETLIESLEAEQDRLLMQTLGMPE